MTAENPHAAHTHVFSAGNPWAEKNTARVVLITAVMMVIEIVGGYLLNSMALLADGWHMSSHALALGLSLLAYSFSRKLANDPRFSFGTWKIEVLAGYTSAILLLFVAGLMAYQSVERLIAPSAIHYNEAIAISILGLTVNLACAWLLKDVDHHHHHGHDHDHHHDHDHADGNAGDLNLRAAYIHVISDAATSALAIFALIGGKLWGAVWLDPLMGIAGAVLVTVWSFGLLRESGKVLLDAEMNAPVVEEIRDVIQASPIPAAIADLHVWRVGRGQYACILALLTSANVDGEYFRRQLQVHEELVHVTVEILRGDAD
ncbi:MAG TPA: CDF family Co(II)/Ni(II) efflux transporter DmeF [Oxalicibacterium sp.]|nr:CDF family Co(II)/Ni(II) efflux transporter DmeF [Oxalicibacterium sp.]